MTGKQWLKRFIAEMEKLNYFKGDGSRLYLASDILRAAEKAAGVTAEEVL